MAKKEKMVVEQPKEKQLKVKQPKVKQSNEQKPQITTVDSLECFGIVTDPKNKEKLRIVIGNHCASFREFDSVAEAKVYIEKKPYELIMALAFEMAYSLINKK